LRVRNYGACNGRSNTGAAGQVPSACVLEAPRRDSSRFFLSQPPVNTMWSMTMRLPGFRTSLVLECREGRFKPGRPRTAAADERRGHFCGFGTTVRALAAERHAVRRTSWAIYWQ